MTDEQATPEKKGKRKNINRWRESRLRRLKFRCVYDTLYDNDVRRLMRIEQLEELLTNK